MKNAAVVLRNRQNTEKHATIAARAAAEGSVAVQRARAEASVQARLERRRELDERAAEARRKKREENVARGLLYVPRGTWQSDALRVFASPELWEMTATRDENGRSIAPVLDADDLIHLYWVLGILAENDGGSVTLVGAERARPRWPRGASFRRDCLEHLAKNAFIEFERQGQVWTFGLGERLKAAN